MQDSIASERYVPDMHGYDEGFPPPFEPTQSVPELSQKAEKQAVPDVATYFKMLVDEARKGDGDSTQKIQQKLQELIVLARQALDAASKTDPLPQSGRTVTPPAIPFPAVAQPIKPPLSVPDQMIGPQPVAELAQDFIQDKVAHNINSSHELLALIDNNVDKLTNGQLVGLLQKVSEWIIDDKGQGKEFWQSTLYPYEMVIAVLNRIRKSFQQENANIIQTPDQAQILSLTKKIVENMMEHYPSWILWDQVITILKSYEATVALEPNKTVNDVSQEVMRLIEKVVASLIKINEVRGAPITPGLLNIPNHAISGRTDANDKLEDYYAELIRKVAPN